MFRAETLGTKQDIRNHSEAPTSGASTICRRNSKMKERNIELFKQSQLGLDDTFKFHCTMCGRCCINREDILLPPRDLYAMAKELNFTSTNVCWKVLFRLVSEGVSDSRASVCCIYEKRISVKYKLAYGPKRCVGNVLSWACNLFDAKYKYTE